MIEREAAPGIHRIQNNGTNFYVVEEEGRFTVVDAGLPVSWSSLERAVGDLGRIEALILTHGHFDHIGIAERMRRELGVPVHVHDADAELALRPRSPLRSLRPAPRALPVVAGFVATRAFWPRAVEDVRRFDGGTLPVPGAPRVVPTPGHTPGHVAFHFPDRDALVAGDAVVTVDPFTASRGPQLVSTPAPADAAQALASLDAIAATGAATVLTGHGPAWRDGAAALAERAGARSLI